MDRGARPPYADRVNLVAGVRMGRGRFVVAVSVALCLALPPVAQEAHAADSAVDCGFSAVAQTRGFDGSTGVATYVVRATWCVETIYESRTVTEDDPTDAAVSDGSDDAKVDKAKKKKAKGKKGKRRRKRERRSKDETRTRTRTERRAVKTCMTDVQVEAEPLTHVAGATLIGSTTTQITSADACASRSYHVVGRFGRDYVPGVAGVSRSVIRQEIGGVAVENYPLGRVGYFDITVHFDRGGGARCDRCLPSFAFCDVRFASGDDAGCLHI